MQTVRGEPVNPIEVETLLTQLGKTEAECEQFFGPLTWSLPGFAIEFLRNTCATKTWASLYKKGWNQ